MGAEIADPLAGVVASVSTGTSREGPKVARERVSLVRGVGLAGDAHAGDGHRAVSLLAEGDVAPLAAALGENLRTRALALDGLSEGRRLRVGPSAILQITERARIPGPNGLELLWVFARVVRGGEVSPRDIVTTDPAFDRPRFAVVTLSDRRATGSLPDESGTLAAAILAEALATEPLSRDVLPDDRRRLERRLVELADDEVMDLIVTTGGTGLAPRDVTPEATRAVLDREVPGIAEAIRAGGLAKTPLAMLSRAVCGQRGTTLIVNLSGSPKAVKEQLAILLPVLPHVLSVASGVPQSCAELPRDGRL